MVNIQVYAEIEEQALTGITVADQTLFAGESKQADVTCVPEGSTLPSDVTYNSSNESVFEVSNSGLITAVAKGTATLTVASASKSISETATITVNNYPLSGIEVGKQYMITGSETKLQLKAIETVNNNDIGTTFEFTDDPSDDYLVSIENGARTGSVALKFNDKYLAWITGNTLTSITSVDVTSSWVVTYENSVYSVVNLATYQTSSERFLKLNVQNTRFACYTSGQEDIAFVEYSAPVQTKTLESISLSGNYKTEYYVGDEFSTANLVVTAHYEESYNQDEEIALSECEITGYDMSTPGQQEVTVAYGGKSASYNITVTAVAPATLTVTYSGGEVETGHALDASKVEVTITNNNGTEYDFQDSELEFHLGAVDGQEVTPQSVFSQAGTYTIYVVLTAHPEVYGSFQVTVVDAIIAAEGIQLNKAQMALVVGGEDDTLVATVTPEGATGQVSWNLSKEGVVTLTDNLTAANSKTVHAVAKGEVTVTVTVGNFNAQCVVTVTEPAPTMYTISFDKGEGTGTMEALSLAKGSTIDEAPECGFTAPEGKEFDKWLDQTGAPIVFPYTVNDDATFYASYKNGATPVVPAASETVIDGAALQLPTDNKVLEPTDVVYNNVTYCYGGGGSGNGTKGYPAVPENATNRFSDNNMILMGKKGAYLYNKTALDGVIKTFEVVSNGANEQNQSPSVAVQVAVAFGTSVMSAELPDTADKTQLDTINKVFDFSPEATQADCTYFRLQIMSAHNAQFQIRINGTPAEVVNVTGVSLNKSSTQIEVGANETLVATVAPENATNKKVTWESSAPTIATVNENGKVVGVAEGTAVITVKTVDGEFTATCNVTVTPRTTPLPTTHAGTLEDPKTIAEALEIAEQAGGTAGEALYFTGKVTEKASKIGTSKDLGNVKIGDDDGNEILIYYLKKSETATADNGLNWDSADDLKVGDVLIIKGAPFTYNNTTPEFGNGTFVYSINGVPTPTQEQGGGGEGGEGGDTPTPTPTPGTKTLQSIEVVAPTKTEYFVGESLDLTGFKVILHFTDGTQQELSDLSKLGAITVDTKRPGEKVITVTYEGQTATFKVNVTRNPEVHDGCHCSIIAGSTLLSITTLMGAGLLMLRKRKEK